MPSKIKIASVATLAALTFMAYSASASAAWVAKSDSWCKKHGLKPVCEIYEKDKAVRARTDTDIQRPRVGQTRSGLPKQAGTNKPAIFDRWGTARTQNPGSALRRPRGIPENESPRPQSR